RSPAPASARIAAGAPVRNVRELPRQAVRGAVRVAAVAAEAAVAAQVRAGVEEPPVERGIELRSRTEVDGPDDAHRRRVHERDAVPEAIGDPQPPAVR